MARLPAGIRKRPSGGYEYRGTYEGKRYSVGGSTIEECKKRAREKEKEIAAGMYHTNETITFDQYFKEWIKQKEIVVKGTTIANYLGVFRKYISPALGRCRVKNIERRQIVTLVNKIAESGLPSAANRVRLVVCMVLQSAMIDNIVLRNVSDHIPQIKRQRTAARENIHRELTDQELTTFFSLAENSIFCNAFKFMLVTGTRAGECGALQWRDIDRKHKLIHIKRTVTKDKNNKFILGEVAKTRTSRRDIPINKAINEVITRQWNLYRDTHEFIALNDFVFPGSHGQMTNEGSLGNAIRRIIQRGEKNGIILAHFSAHAFRDTFASRAIRAGIAPNTLKELLGHANLSMTMDLYAHVNQEDKIAAMEKMKAISF